MAVTISLGYVVVYRPMRLLIDQYRAVQDEVKTLRGILTICSACKKIRTGEQSWEKIEAYVHAHTERSFLTHFVLTASKGSTRSMWIGSTNK